MAAVPTCIALGVSRSDPALSGLGCFILFILPFAYLLAWRNMRSIRYERQLQPNSFVASPNSAVLTLQAGNASAVAVQIRDEALGDVISIETNRAPAVRRRSAADVPITLEPNGRQITTVPTIFRKRGNYNDFDFQLVSDYPFGLFRKTISGTLPSPVTVYPLPLTPCGDAAAIINHASAGYLGTAGTNGADGDFRNIREYRYGDPLKLVHWPLSLRHRRSSGPDSPDNALDLVVREFQPPAPSRRLLVFHDYAPRDNHFSQAQAETALELLTGLLVTMARDGAPFDFVAPFTDWEPVEIAGAGPELHKLLSFLATVRLTGTLKSNELARHVADFPLNGTRLIVLGAAEASTWEQLIPVHPGNRYLDPKAPLRRLPPLEIAV
jgi:uncharacterized protein (DUF58 family)